MKKIVLLFTIVSAISLSAQTDKGWRSVGGNGSLRLDFKDKSYGFSLNPELYFFVANNFAIGADFGGGFGYSKANDSTSVSSVFGYVAPGACYYFRDTEHKWRPYVIGNIGYELSATHSKLGSVTANSNYNGLRAYAGGGLAWFFTEHAAFDTRMYIFNYSGSTARFYPSFSIGIQAYFHHE